MNDLLSLELKINMEEHLARDWFTRIIFMSLLCCTTTLAEKNRLKFIMVGDIGGLPFKPYSTYSQRFASQQIAKVPDVEFLVGLGDNIYFSGVKDVDDKRFRETFENVYGYPSLQKDWYMIAGNHDYHGNISAQLLYSKKSKRWRFPYYFYTKVFNIPRTNTTLQLVMIDTTILCFQRHIKDKNVPQSKTQLKWITHTLENSKADYLLVGGHHPMYSAGFHGPTACVQKKLLNLFSKHKVTAYFSGHDHNLQHIKYKNSPVEYFVNGATNFKNPWQLSRGKLEPNSLKYFYGGSSGFLVLTATPEHLKVRFHTTRPSKTYRRYLIPRNQQRNTSHRLKYSQILLNEMVRFSNSP